MSYDEFYISYEKHQTACSWNYWFGCITGAVGMLIIGFVSLYVAGAFLAD